MKSRMLEEMVHVYRKSAGSRAHRKCVLFNLEEVEAKMEEVNVAGGMGRGSVSQKYRQLVDKI
jgi:hypothetical protein